MQPGWPAVRAWALVPLGIAVGVLALAGPSSGRIVVSGDEWAFSDDGLPGNPAYVSNVVSWFGLSPIGTGKKVLILDGQSWNSGYNGTTGAFGSQFRNLLTGLGASVTYLGYQDDLVPLAGHDAVFVDGRMVKAANLPVDLAGFVSAGGAVYVAGGTGTFSPANADGEAAYWQPFFTAATGFNDFGFVGGGAWLEAGPPLQGAGPIGTGVSSLRWYMGQGVQVGSSPDARAAVWDASRTLVATWLAPAGLSIRRQDSDVVLSWSGNRVLQSSVDLLGPYEDLVAATSPHTNRIDLSGSRFYRLRP